MIWSIFSVTEAEHAAFLAFSGLECGRTVLATELVFATHCAKCYLHQDRKGTRSTKGGQIFSISVLFTYEQHRRAIYFRKTSLAFLAFPRGAKRGWGSLIFLFIFASNSFLLILSDLFSVDTGLSMRLDQMTSRGFLTLPCNFQDSCCYFGFFLTPNYLGEEKKKTQPKLVTILR